MACLSKGAPALEERRLAGLAAARCTHMAEGRLELLDEVGVLLLAYERARDNAR